MKLFIGFTRSRFTITIVGLTKFPSEGARIAIAALYPSGSRNQPPRRTMSSAISQPKYLLENDEIIFSSF